jgi:sec-independent protein translocase protein TatB
MTSLQKDVGDALRIDDIDKPAVSASDAPVTPVGDAPAIPTTPEPPIPETFTAADAHAAAMEPLAITREVQPLPAPQDITPAAPDVLKDAKAS